MSDTKVELPATFKIDSIDTVYGALKSTLDGDGPVVVDGGAVETVDFAALQLLMAFARQCATSQRDVAFKDFSEPLNVAVNDVGAGAVLGVA
ncbi:MAG: STAS domain-containing protein [Pseudomonadota bacterium]